MIGDMTGDQPGVLIVDAAWRIADDKRYRLVLIEFLRARSSETDCHRHEDASDKASFSSFDYYGLLSS